jgi:hypothetical protein
MKPSPPASGMLSPAGRASKRRRWAAASASYSTATYSWACGWKGSLIARLGPGQGEAALREPLVGVFDITGTPMRNRVLVKLEGVDDDDQLKAWIEQATKFVRTPPKKV